MSLGINILKHWYDGKLVYYNIGMMIHVILFKIGFTGLV